MLELWLEQISWSEVRLTWSAVLKTVHTILMKLPRAILVPKSSNGLQLDCSVAHGHAWDGQSWLLAWKAESCMGGWRGLPSDTYRLAQSQLDLSSSWAHAKSNFQKAQFYRSCKRWDLNPCSFELAPEASALDQLGHACTTVIENVPIFGIIDTVIGVLLVLTHNAQVFEARRPACPQTAICKAEMWTTRQQSPVSTLATQERVSQLLVDS